jgi:TctA family transporter
MSRYLIRIAYIPVGLIIPLVLILAVLGSSISALNWQHLVIFMVIGVFAYGLKRYHWPRPPFVIGLALGPIAENSLHQSLAIWGLNFLLRPISLLLIGLIAVNLAVYYWRKSIEGQDDRQR